MSKTVKITYTPMDSFSEDFSWMKDRVFRNNPPFTARELNQEVFQSLQKIEPMNFYRTSRQQCELQSVTLEWQRTTGRGPLALWMQVKLPYPWSEWIFSVDIDAPRREKDGKISFWWGSSTREARRMVDSSSSRDLGLSSAFTEQFRRIVPQDQFQPLGNLIPQIYLWVVEAFLKASSQIGDEIIEGVRQDREILDRELQVEVK